MAQVNASTVVGVGVGVRAGVGVGVKVGVGGFRVGGQGYGVKGVAWHCQMSEKEQERGWCGCGQRACMHAVKHGGL